MSNMIKIFDTTLRDGEQSPGASMTTDEKVKIALQLEKLGVDVIEAGFAVASPGDFDAVERIAKLVKNSTVCSLARSVEKDIKAAGEAIILAPKKRIHTFIATSKIHMEYKLQMKPEEVIKSAVDAVMYAKTFTDDVEFSCEDATRSEMSFLKEIIDAVTAAGAKTINLPDTVGYAVPSQYGQFVKELVDVAAIRDAIISVHCHNDLGLAVANSLSAVQYGARQVECTINGLGERAGNAALEEVVMAIRTRRDKFECDVTLDATQIVGCSKLVSSITGFPVQRNKAIVGVNAFAHESGIHQDGILKNRETYEIMRAQDVGWSNNQMVLGKHSGRNAFRSHLEEIGVTFSSEEELNNAFYRFKDLADKKHEIYDEDLQALVNDSASTVQDSIRLVTLQTCTGTGEKPKATVTLSVESEEKTQVSDGAGSVDAVFKAIECIVDSGCELELYSVSNVTTGTDSQGEVTVRIRKGDHRVNGQGTDTDIIMASAKAYVNALNKILMPVAKKHPQKAV